MVDQTTHVALSLIIPTYQRCASLERLLRALNKQTLAPECFEVIVSIDGSEDGTREMVSQFAAPYRLRSLWHPNQGLAATLNAGIHAANGDLLVFLDDDMEPAPDFLVAHLQAHPSGSRLAVMGAVPMVVTPSSPPLVAYMNLKYEAFWERWSKPGYEIKYIEFYSGNFSIRRDLLLSIGAFDDVTYFNCRYGGQDAELARRMMKAGIKIIYSAAALAHQYYLKDFRALALDTISEGRTEVLLACKFPDTFNNTRLSWYTRVPRTLYLVRAVLLSMSRVWAGVPELMIRLMGWLERRCPANLNRYYHLSLGYFYWLGALATLRENRRAGRGLFALNPPQYADGASNVTPSQEVPYDSA